MSKETQQYWRTNLKIIGICLVTWFIVSFGAGILFVEELNQVMIGGYKLGFWFAHQGSIYFFVLLIFFYSWRMNRLDHEYGLDDDEEE